MAAHLVVLPCPVVLPSLLRNLCVHISKVLLPAGDIETNTGPDYAQFSRQLQQIAGDLQVIKEEHLPAIESKLDKLSQLESKISTFMNQITNLQKFLPFLELNVDILKTTPEDLIELFMASQKKIKRVLPRWHREYMKIS